MNKSSLYARALVALYELLDSAAFDGVQPVVGIGGFNENDDGTTAPAEFVLVLTTAPMDSQQDFGSMRGDRSEEFIVTVEVGTSVPGRTVREALGRLEELTSKVESSVRDLQDPSETLLDGVRAAWDVQTVDPWLGPRAEADGYDASCVLSLRVRARI